MRTLIIVPTYNEQANLENLVHLLLDLPHHVDVLVVDDNSPDGTGAIADQMAAATPRVRVLHRPAKAGLGTAYVAGFRYALDAGYDCVVQMDADFSHRPEDLPALLDAAHMADVVVGSRNIPAGAVQSWPLWRRILSRGGSHYARIILQLPVRDCTSGFKCLRRSALQALDLDGLHANGYGFQIEVNYQCHRAGLRFVEVPIIFPDRVRGVSKMSRQIISEAALLVLQLRFARPPQPLHHRLSRSHQ